MTRRNRKYRIGLAESRIAISGNYMLRRPKRSKNEAVAPEEEDSAFRRGKWVRKYTSSCKY
jgi:hypothetical protein